MVFKVFSIRDCTTGFNQPFVEINENVAKRNFAYAVNNSDLPGFAPNDFDLYCIGEFDSNTGTIKPENVPVLVTHGTEVIARE